MFSETIGQNRIQCGAMSPTTKIVKTIVVVKTHGQLERGLISAAKKEKALMVTR